MTIGQAMKTVEELLEGVAAKGEENWERLIKSKAIIRDVRKQLETLEVKEHAGSEDAVRQRDQQDGTDAVRGVPAHGGELGGADLG